MFIDLCEKLLLPQPAEEMFCNILPKAPVVKVFSIGKLLSIRTVFGLKITAFVYKDYVLCRNSGKVIF